MEVTYKSWLKFLLLYISIFIMTSLFSKKYNIISPYDIACIISSSISIIGYSISKINLDIQKNNIYKDLSLVLGSIGGLNVLYLIYKVSHFDGSNMDITTFRLEQLILMILSALLFSVIIHKSKKKSFVKMYVLIINIFAVVSFFIIEYSNLSDLVKMSSIIIALNIIVPIITILVYINNFISLSTRKRIFRSETIKDLRIISLLCIFSSISYLIYINIDILFVSNFMYYILIAISFIYAGLIFKLIIRDIIKKPNQNLYNKYLEEKNKLQQYIIELENKNEELINYKHWIYRSLVSMPEGIIICENKKIVFANKKVQQYLKITNIEDLLGVNYEDIVKSRSKEEQEDGLSLNNIRLEYKENEFIGQELNLKSKDNFGCTNMIILNNINLEKRLEELVNKLEYKNKVDLSRNELLSNLSHEFKTPVNIIYSTAQLQELNFKKQDLEKEIEYNNLIKRNCNRLIRLINNFIDSTKFESNMVRTELKLVNIVSLVEDLTESVINFAENKNISITFDTELEEIYTLVDIEFMERIILNVLSNAIKYNK